MESDRHFELYLAELRRWATPEQIGRILRWATPDEIAAMLKSAGSPDELTELLATLKARAEVWEWNRGFWGRVKQAAVISGLVGGVFAAAIAVLALVERLQGLWPE